MIHKHTSQGAAISVNLRCKDNIKNLICSIFCIFLCIFMPSSVCLAPFRAFRTGWGQHFRKRLRKKRTKNIASD